MRAKTLSGKILAAQIKKDIAKEVQAQIAAGLPRPGLATVLVGNDPASELYVRRKGEACQEVGFVFKPYALPAQTTQAELLYLLDKLNLDPEVSGILLQLPLPKHLQTDIILEHINPDKDVDGFHSANLGKLAKGISGYFHPCTPQGIMQLLAKHITKPLSGMNAVIVGHSIIVGKPMALELLAANATVTICHAYTNRRTLKKYVKNADLLIVAVGKPNLIKGCWLKKDVIVVDVGINRLASGKIVGDVELAQAIKRAAWITPVPGGVGPMTIAVLLQNTLLAAKNQIVRS